MAETLRELVVALSLQQIVFEILQHPHFMDAVELLMIRSKTNPELNTAVQYWTDRMEKK